MEAHSLTQSHMAILDQHLLAQFVWPHAQKDMVAHDSFLCRAFPQMHRPWPTKRINGPNFTSPGFENFVGCNNPTPNGYMGYPKFQPCPEQCRPKEHRDWLFC